MSHDRIAPDLAGREVLAARAAMMVRASTSGQDPDTTSIWHGRAGSRAACTSHEGCNDRRAQAMQAVHAVQATTAPATGSAPQRGAQVVMHDPEYGDQAGVVTRRYDDGALEVACSMGGLDSRALVYTINANRVTDLVSPRT
jgi:hypothetical protein